MKFFDILKALTDTKELIDLTDSETESEYDMFMINRWISMCEMYTPLVADLNMYPMDKASHCKFLQKMLPKRKVYFNYIRPKKDVDLKSKKYIAHYFKCTVKHVDGFLDMLSDEQIKSILNKYKYGSKNKMMEI